MWWLLAIVPLAAREEDILQHRKVTTTHAFLGDLADGVRVEALKILEGKNEVRDPFCASQGRPPLLHPHLKVGKGKVVLEKQQVTVALGSHRWAALQHEMRRCRVADGPSKQFSEIANCHTAPLHHTRLDLRQPVQEAFPGEVLSLSVRL